MVYTIWYIPIASWYIPSKSGIYHEATFQMGYDLRPGPGCANHCASQLGHVDTQAEPGRSHRTEHVTRWAHCLRGSTGSTIRVCDTENVTAATGRLRVRIRVGCGFRLGDMRPVFTEAAVTVTVTVVLVTRQTVTSECPSPGPGVPDRRGAADAASDSEATSGAALAGPTRSPSNRDS